jgi:hypothetical protein
MDESQFPNTIAEAEAQGYTEPAADDQQFGPMGAEPRLEAKAVADRNCSGLPPGSWCFKGVLHGKPIVLFCDEHGNCRRRFVKRD